VDVDASLSYMLSAPTEGCSGSLRLGLLGPEWQSPAGQRAVSSWRLYCMGENFTGCPSSSFCAELPQEPFMNVVGLMVPSSNTVMEEDLHRGLGGVAIGCTTRMRLAEVTARAEQDMLDHEAIPAAERLADTQPEVVVFGCTSASSLHDAAYDERFRSRLSEIVGAPVLGVLSSVAELTDRIATSLEAAGIRIGPVLGLGIRDNRAIAALTPSQIVEAVLRMDLTRTKALFCSCTNMRACEALPSLVEQARLPVVTSNQAVIAGVRRLVSSVGSRSRR
jgi:maleate isomerase